MKIDNRVMRLPSKLRSKDAKISIDLFISMGSTYKTVENKTVKHRTVLNKMIQSKTVHITNDHKTDPFNV